MKKKCITCGKKLGWKKQKYCSQGCYPNTDIKKEGISIKLIAVFGLAHEENIRNVSVALAKAGYYIKIGRKDEFYEVNVYTDRIT